MAEQRTKRATNLEAVEIGDGAATRSLARGGSVFGYPGETLTATGSGTVMVAAPGGSSSSPSAANCSGWDAMRTCRMCKRGPSGPDHEPDQRGARSTSVYGWVILVTLRWLSATQCFAAPGRQEVVLACRPWRLRNCSRSELKAWYSFQWGQWPLLV